MQHCSHRQSSTLKGGEWGERILENQPCQQVRHEGGDGDGDEAGHHEGVVEEVLTNLGGAGTVEIDGSHIRGVRRDEEIAIDGGEHTEQHRSGDTEGVRQRQHRYDDSAL